MPVINSIAAAEDEMTAWRRDFHMHPELGFEEFRTSEIVAKLLESWGIEVTRGVAGTGVVGTLRGSGPGERSIGLRADMDCLPMDEQTGLPYASQTPGKMHACGHDGHTSMLLGAAKYLAETRNFAGTVHFIFQPAEEGKGGGREMVKEGLFDRFPCDEVYGMHNWPLLPAGRIAVRPGPIMAAADQFDVEIHGKGAHGAMPHLGIDPVLIAAQVITALQFPASAKLSGTVRTYRPETQDMIERGIAAISTGIATGFGATAVANYRRGYPATVNPAKEAGIAAEIAASVVGEENVIHDAPPVMGAEDFSFMLNERPGCYIWLGQSRGSDDAMVHHPKYDFNDSVLPVGASWFATMVESRLKR